MSTKKVKTAKKNTKKKKNTKNNYNLIIIIPVVILVILLIVVAIVTNNNGVTCTKDGNFEEGVKQSIEYKFDKRISFVKVKKTIIVSEKLESSSYSYADVIKKSLESEYSSLADFKSTVKKNKVIVEYTYSDNKYHILDDLIISINNDEVSVNVITEDKFNKFASIDFSKENKIDVIKQDMNKKGFICK